MHHVKNLNSFYRKWSTVEALANTVPCWKLLGEELWQDVRAPLGKLSCNQCSNRLKDDKLVHANPNLACGDTDQVPSAVLGTILGKSIGTNSKYPLN